VSLLDTVTPPARRQPSKTSVPRLQKGKQSCCSLYNLEHYPLFALSDLEHSHWFSRARVEMISGNKMSRLSSLAVRFSALSMASTPCRLDTGQVCPVEPRELGLKKAPLMVSKEL
jgi:hypothetical protein